MNGNIVLRIVLTLILVVGATALPVMAEDCTSTSFGDGVSLEEASQVSRILASPDDWAGQTVRIEGEVKEVCQIAGCWMEITAGDGPETLKVKVEDGVIVFPAAARGQHAVAQGTVEVQDMTAEKWESYQRHLAEEQGLEFDPESLGEGPFRSVRVKGTGAEICL